MCENHQTPKVNSQSSLLLIEVPRATVYKIGAPVSPFYGLALYILGEIEAF